MISIALGPEPEILVENSNFWGQEYATALHNGHNNPPERYRRKGYTGRTEDRDFKKMCIL